MHELAYSSGRRHDCWTLLCNVFRRKRRQITTAALLGCLVWVSAASANEQLDELAFGNPSVTKLDVSELADIRAGAALPVTREVSQQIGVILWDEVRLPPPPGRHQPVDTRIGGEMNFIQRQ